MINSSLKALMPDYALEAFNDMRLSQPTRDRLHYFDVVLEGSNETNAALLQKLYTDVLSKSNIDFGQIPDSQGALTKYKDYKLMTQSMDQINQLFNGIKSDEVKLMNDLHDMIIKCRKDFEFGYSFNIEIIKITYCTAVMTLHEMINLCILAYTRVMRKQAGITFDFKTMKKKDVIILRSAKSLLKMYNSGQWNKIIIQLKKDPNMIGAEIATTESFGSKLSSGVSFVMNHPVAGGIVAVTTAIVILLVVIRKLVYWYYAGATSLKDFLRNEKEFVDFVINQEKQDGTSDTVISKHQKLADRMESLADKIEIKILKTNTDATKELAKSDQTTFSASEFKTVNVGGDIEF